MLRLSDLTHRAFGVRTELVRPEGYPLEDYTVQTSDGYLLSMYRLPAGLSEEGKAEQAGCADSATSLRLESSYCDFLIQMR